MFVYRELAPAPRSPPLDGEEPGQLEMKTTRNEPCHLDFLDFSDFLGFLGVSWISWISRIFWDFLGFLGFSRQIETFLEDN